MVKEAAEAIEPAWEELSREAAQGEVLHNGGTTAVILETIRERRRRQQAQDGDADDPERTGTFIRRNGGTGSPVFWRCREFRWITAPPREF